MRLATLRIDGGTIAVRIEESEAVVLPASDVGSLLNDPNWREIGARDGQRFSLVGIPPARWAPVVPQPRKIICVGLNYRQHILEMGRELPSYPTLFAKFADALTGPFDEILLPKVSEQVDWEGELVVVIGTSVRDADVDSAAAAIAGYTLMNDVSVRDYQYRTLQWLQGKTFEALTPLGPALVTTDEWSPGPNLTTHVNDERTQHASTSDLVFSPVELVAYVSSITTLRPGDIIATGTPGGVGQARSPARYLRDGDRVRVSIEGLGALENHVLATPAGH